VFVTLYVGDEAISTKTVNVANGGTIKFTNLNKEVNSTPVELSVKADFADAYTG